MGEMKAIIQTVAKGIRSHRSAPNWKVEEGRQQSVATLTRAAA